MNGLQKRGWLLLGAVLLVQVALMLGAFLPVPHSGGDNAGYLGLAHSLLDRGAYLDLYLPGEPIHTKYPPGFPALLALAGVFGAETWGAFKAVVAGTATLAVLFTFLWVRERRDPVVAALVAGLLAASSALVYHSHWILSDVPFLGLTFFSLWCLERWETVEGGVGDESGTFDGGGAGTEVRAGAGSLPPALWLALGAGGAIAAYFTRSAGLPLILALAALLALRRRWRSLVAYGVAFGVPAFAWWLRNRGAPDTYLAEFWLVDPYRPDLGRVGLGGLVGRMLTNAWGYVSSHIPTGVTGLDGGFAAALGLTLVGLAVWGWIERVREKGTALQAVEMFFPLYAGLILLWPEVWSGDRFALPLLPPLFLYAGVGLKDVAGRVHSRAVLPASVVAVLILVGAALGSWVGDARAASSCMSATRARGLWACAAPAMADFSRVAVWSGSNLPEGSVVISRKPRFFYVLGGLKSQVFPFSREPDAFFREAERLGAGYVLLDRLDDLAVYYVGSAIRASPEAFCPVQAFGTASNPGGQLLGILQTPIGGADAGEEGTGGGAPGSGGGREGGEIRLSPCPPGTLRPEPAPVPDYSSSVVPLFGRSAS